MIPRHPEMAKSLKESGNKYLWPTQLLHKNKAFLVLKIFTKKNQFFKNSIPLRKKFIKISLVYGFQVLIRENLLVNRNS